MDPTPQQFDDPNLKVALKRAVGPAGASAELRNRVAGLVARESAATPMPTTTHASTQTWRGSERSPIRLLPMRWLAVAACVLIAAGTAVVIYQRHHQANEQQEYLEANRTLFNDMIKTEQGQGVAAEAVTVALTDREALQKALSARLGRSVPVPDWQPRGWTLASAAVGPVSGHPASQLRYTNGQRQLLLVCLPAQAMKNGDEEDKYEYMVQGHPVAGFIKDQSLNCVIGDANSSLDEIVKLKDDPSLHG